MKIAIAGMGYVGLVTGVCLAEKGHDVTCVDLDEAKVGAVRKGEPPIFEAGLEELIQRNLGGRFNAQTNLAEAVGDADLTMIAVGTPFDKHAVDLTAVRTATREIGEAISTTAGFPVVVVKSTVVPGTTRQTVLPLLEEASGKRAGVDFGVGVNPEFLTEGRAVEDFMRPDRLVLGSLEARTAALFEELYEGFPGVPRVRTTLTTAEMIKYASNALLATMISFSNELADVCTAVGDVDSVDVSRGLHSSMYLTVEGRPAPIVSFLEAGCGFGGSCLPKDVKALIAHGRALGRPMPVLRAVIDVNERRPDEIVRLVEKRVPRLAGAKITVLGLAFKPDTDDVRESPAVPIIERLVAAGASVIAHDPIVRRLPIPLIDTSVRLEADLGKALESTDAIVVVTRWRDYERVPELLAGLDPQPAVIDGRRMLDPASVDRYEGIGL
jgi:UDPglucose 6-dehydrogenase/GDP-mannose 6-dehydrogenase